MSIEERQSEFQDNLQQYVPANYHISPCYGTSNIARMVPGGIVLAVTNLANYSEESGPLCLISRICPLPSAELYFCAVIESGKEALLSRLKEMLDAHSKGDSRFSRENNNTSVCIAADQQLYFYNKKISEIETPIQDYLGSPIAIDKFYYSVYTSSSDASSRAVLKNLVAQVEHFVGAGKVVELNTWGQYNFLPPVAGAAYVSPANAVTEFVSVSRAAGLQISSQLAQRFMASLLAKRFLILTGLAGSGKTKLADAFATWICADPKIQSTLIPVGADWIGNENVLGYPNGLEKESYVTKPALRLILEADKHRDTPYFLILDEMNLSHVERYFSDILSAIESEKNIHLHQDDKRMDRDTEVPREIGLPANLFIVGTVNVDETTYMFSPKVLDRANVIEFRVRADEISGFVSAPIKPELSDVAGKGAGFGERFVSLSQEAAAVPQGVKAQFETEMAIFFHALHEHGAEFGYRVAHEAARYLYFDNQLGNYQEGDPNWFSKSFDCLVLQKLLPKLHGSRAKLGPLLKKLWYLCTIETPDGGPEVLKRAEEAARSTEKSSEPSLDPGILSAARYPLSAEKIGRMWRLLNDNGFTSFAEA